MLPCVEGGGPTGARTIPTGWEAQPTAKAATHTSCIRFMSAEISFSPGLLLLVRPELAVMPGIARAHFVFLVVEEEHGRGLVCHVLVDRHEVDPAFRSAFNSDSSSSS